MSAEHAIAFRKKLHESDELQREVADAASREAEAGVIALAGRHGLVFTKDEMYATLEHAELSEFELDLVAGGVAAAGGNDATCWRPTPAPGTIQGQTPSTTGGG